jgi:hypothetical protein
VAIDRSFPSGDCVLPEAGIEGPLTNDRTRRNDVAKDHGSSVKNDKQYEGLRKKGMSKSRAAAISNSEGSSSRGGKSSGSSQSKQSSGSGSGGNKAQKAAAGRKGGKKSNS